MFYKIARNTLLPNLDSLLLGKTQPLVTFLSTDKYITLFYVCFYLKTPYLIYIVDSLALNAQPTAP